MTPEQNIQGHAFNALTEALTDSLDWMPLSARERVAASVVAAVEPLIVRRSLAAAYRKLAEWSEEQQAEALLGMAAEVEALTEDNDTCCPVCQETTCDDGCPLAPVRNRWQEDATPRARCITENETAACYQIWHHGRIAVHEAELAKPAEGTAGFTLYCRELLPGKYEIGWERKP